MLNLFAAIMSSALLAIILRLSEKKETSSYGVCLFNYMTCSLIGLTFVENKSLKYIFVLPPKVMFICVLSGVLLLASLALYRYNMAKSGTVLAAVFSKLGILFPTLMSFFVFREVPSVLQVLGIVIAIAAILVINLKKQEKSEEKKSAGKGAFVNLIILLLVGGACDCMSKIFENQCDRIFDDRYLLLGFFFGGVSTVVMMLISKEKPKLMDVLFGVLVGIPNYFVSRFLLHALIKVPAFIVYPSYSVATIVVISILSLIIFREKLSKRQLCGVGMILVALALLNI